MIIRQVDEVAQEKIITDGVKGVIKQNLIAPEDGAPNFTLRRFSVAPGGYTYHHTHEFEHEIFVLSGEGIIRNANGETKILKDMAALILQNEIHQIINTGKDELMFLCIIPNQY
jgi:quercetin dioxygenase-like cupin family protein